MNEVASNTGVRSSMQLLRSSHTRSSLLSLLMLTTALGGLWLGHNLRLKTPPAVEIREIATAPPPPAPPPPAPPPPVEQPLEIIKLTTQAQGSGPAIEMLDLKQPEIDMSMPEAPRIQVDNMQLQSLEVDWEALGLDELDALPALLTPLHINFPRSLTQRGITTASVNLDILIDQDGRVTLITIKNNPYPKLVKELHRLIREARFGSPMKNGEPVRARFILPLNLSSK